MNTQETSAKIGKALYNIRKRQRISRRELAQRSGVGETTMRDFENNPEYSITLNTLLSLCSGLNITLEDLLREAGMITGACPSIPDAIRNDLNLTEGARNHLVGLYELLIKK